MLRNRQMILIATFQALLVLGANALELSAPVETDTGNFGYDVSAVPDVDGDGLSDIIVGAWTYTPSPLLTFAGRAFVFNGVTGQLIHTLVSPNEQERGLFGACVLGIDDLDGDSRGDFLVAATKDFVSPDPDDSGLVYLYSGATASLLRTIKSPTSTVLGHFGWYMTSLPDITGDSIDEIGIGGHRETSGASPSEAGRAHLFDPTNGQLIASFSSPNEETSGYFGWALAAIPDVNGDSRADLGITAWQESPGSSPNLAGRAYVFDPFTQSLIHEVASPSEKIYSHFGYAIAGLNDIDGDNRGDLVIGAYTEEDSGFPIDSGKVHIYSGQTGAWIRTLISPDPQTSGHFGYFVTASPDLNGNGMDDILVNAIWEDLPGGLDDAGRSYIFDPSDGSLIDTIVSQNPESGGWFGRRMASMSDVTGDSIPELIFGAYQEDPGLSPPEAGRAYVLNGSSRLPLPGQNSAMLWFLYD